MAAAGDVPLAPLPDETPLDPSKVVPPRPGGEGTGPAANPAAPATAPLKNSYPSALVSTLKDPATKLKVNVSLDAAEMEEAVSLFAKLLDFGYTLDPMVKGKVTVNINMEMKASEVWLLFEQVLSMGGAYASPQNGCLRILSTPSYPRHQPVAIVAARLAEAAATAHHEFWPDDISVLETSRFAHDRWIHSQQITDAYLLALEVRRDGVFVTLDRGIDLRLVPGAAPRHLVTI